MNFRLLLLFSCQLTCSLIVFGQNIDSCDYKLASHVYDLETGEPIPYVSVVISDHSKGTISISEINGELTPINCYSAWRTIRPQEH